MKKLSRPLWQLLIRALEFRADTRLTCEECLALMEYDAAQLAAGFDMDLLKPVIMNHLQL